MLSFKGSRNDYHCGDLVKEGQIKASCELSHINYWPLHSARIDRTARTCEISEFCFHDTSDTPAKRHFWSLVCSALTRSPFPATSMALES